MRYLALTGGIKPHLLQTIDNRRGATTTLTWRASTEFYVADRRVGTPWVTRLPFPVQVVSQVDVVDAVTGDQLTTRYVYHHGFYDGVEREFRGFGMVEQFDAEAIDPNHADESPDPERFVTLLLDLVGHEKFEDRIMVQSFDWRTLLLVQQRAPAIPGAQLASHGEVAVDHFDRDGVTGKAGQFGANVGVGLVLIEIDRETTRRDRGGNVRQGAAEELADVRFPTGPQVAGGKRRREVDAAWIVVTNDAIHGVGSP